MTAPDDGRRRRLRRLADTRGIVAGIALDHRDSLRATLERRGVGGLTTDDLRDLKTGLVRALAPASTALMLDAELGGRALESGAVPPWVGLIMPLEAQGYEAAGDDRTTSLMPDFPPLEAMRYGADAAKLLVPYRVDRAQAAAQDATVAAAATACHELGLPLVIEPLVYRVSAETAEAYAAAYPGLVVRAVARLVPLGADLLKLPFPVVDLAAAGEATAAAACARLHDACAGTPWVLLGAGVATDVFLDQIRLAGRAGASGFLAGRGIWGPALSADAEATGRLAATSSLVDLERCRDVAARFARPLPSP
ncbi:MAG TPA: tagatose 1,6-diphosphate aldolase [Candidatus Sulfotelmatobacter sp.]|nr:tagatose 1,6-diphosphate aldolase [Candidatus Sulfotelmatobacter sp.]